MNEKIQSAESDQQRNNSRENAELFVIHKDGGCCGKCPCCMGRRAGIACRSAHKKLYGPVDLARALTGDQILQPELTDQKNQRIRKEHCKAAFSCLLENQQEYGNDRPELTVRACNLGQNQNKFIQKCTVQILNCVKDRKIQSVIPFLFCLYHR